MKKNGWFISFAKQNRREGRNRGCDEKKGNIKNNRREIEKYYDIRIMKISTDTGGSIPIHQETKKKQKRE